MLRSFAWIIAGFLAVVGLVDILMAVRAWLLSGPPLSGCRIVVEVREGDAEYQLRAALLRLRRDRLLSTASFAARSLAPDGETREVLRRAARDEDVPLLE